ncbi:MAG TPA: ACP phosphodiesterase [Saprospiraceae bacterium]|nr:ACP phosphodiesterase [Saprospiraceae bacterium]
MNFLGHLLLTYPHRELTMGNLLGDLIRSQEAKGLSEGLQQGFSLHHEIDRQTDQHPAVRELIVLLRPTHAKYAPVVVDILLDHVLAQRWSAHADLTYSEFTQWVYHLVPEYLSFLSKPVASRLESMVMHRWIDGYDTSEKLYQVLLRMDKRASFPSQFVTGVKDIITHRDLFNTSFTEFYVGMQERFAGMIHE